MNPTVDEHRKRHLAGEFVFGLAAPALAEFVLNRVTPLSGAGGLKERHTTAASEAKEFGKETERGETFKKEE